MSLCSQRFLRLGVHDLWGGLEGFMVHCIIVVVYSADCCGSVALLCS